MSADQLWLKMLETSGAVAESNRAAVERSAQALDQSASQLAAAVVALEAARVALAAHTDKLEALVSLRLEFDQLKGKVQALEDESKAGQVGKGDLMWRVAVGLFGVIGAAIAGALITMLIKGGAS